MPTVRWGVSAEDIDGFDRESQFKPYTGPTPPDGVFKFRIARLQYVAGTRDKTPQLRVGLELVPRNKDEKRFTKYWIMAFLNISNKNQFTYVPFLDAIGVSGADFETRTRADEQGTVQRIGKWRHTGEELILVQIKDEEYNGKVQKHVKTFVSIDEDTSEAEDEEEFDDDEYDDEEIAEDDYVDEDEEVADDDEDYEEEPEPEPAPTPRRRPAKKVAPAARSGRRPRRGDEAAF